MTVWTKGTDYSTAWTKGTEKSTTWTKGTKKSSNWRPHNEKGGYLLLENGESKLYLQNGTNYLRLQ